LIFLVGFDDFLFVNIFKKKKREIFKCIERRREEGVKRW